MLRSTLSRAAAAAVIVLLAGCSKSPIELQEQKLLALYDDFKEQAKGRDAAKKDLDYWQNKAISEGAYRRKMQAEQDYQAIALNGSAGSREQLIAVKKHLDDPNRSSRLSGTGAQLQADEQRAWDNAKGPQAEYERTDRRLVQDVLPPLVKAADDYKIAYEAQLGSGFRQSRKTQDALADIANQYWAAKLAVPSSPNPEQQVPKRVKKR